MRPAVVTSQFKRLRLVLRASISMMAFNFMRPEDASRFSRFFDLLRNDALRGASGTIRIALGCSMYSQLRGLDELRAEDAGLDSNASCFYLSSGCHQKVCHHRLLSFVTTLRLLESIQ
jgi:hypothetical protein